MADTGAGDVGPAGETGGAVTTSERSIDTFPVRSGGAGGAGDVGVAELLVNHPASAAAG
jgi:hypothetical protein